MIFYKPSKHVGILTWHYYANFGSQLQAYALKTVVNQIGVPCDIIDYVNPNVKRISFLKETIIIILSNYIKKYNSSFIRFRREYLTPNFGIRNPNRIRGYDSIICGSDQIWAPNCFDPVYMLNFCKSDTVNKISYAASIGLNDIPDEFVSIYKNLLIDFSHISVREKTGAELLEQKCGIVGVEVVADPTLLLDVETYKSIEKSVTISDEYVFCYFLNDKHAYEKVVKEYAQKHNLKIIGWTSNSDDSRWMDKKLRIGPQEFLWLIHNAHTIFTDSYHGTIFSLLFHKCFFLFERFSADDPINQNSRIYQLNEWFNISIRIITQGHSIGHCAEINYDSFETKLKEVRRTSINYLQNALGMENR